MITAEEIEAARVRMTDALRPLLGIAEPIEEFVVDVSQRTDAPIELADIEAAIFEQIEAASEMGRDALIVCGAMSVLLALAAFEEAGLFGDDDGGGE